MSKTDYSTGRADGMSFISNRWVFTDPQGYRVKPEGGGTFKVVSYAGNSERVVYGGQGLSEPMAHTLAARLANKS